MKLTIVFKNEFDVQTKKVYMQDGYLHSVIWDDRMWRMSDISQFFFR